MKYNERELCMIWLDSFMGLEYKHKSEIYAYLQKAQRISQGIKDAKEYIIGQVGEKEYATMLASANQAYLDYILLELQRKEIIAITIESENYPFSFKSIPLPPLVIYAKGNLQLLKEKIFGIVGSRKSIPLSISLAENYSKRLVDAKFTLVTGIAEGIDSAVLKTTIANNGKVISIIAGGFDNIYPKNNIELANKIVDNGGLILSEQPPKIVPKPYHFPIRNRLIAALSTGVLIVSGALKSGTLYTAEYAEEYGKDLFAIPYSAGISSGMGCNDLIKRGAMLSDKPEDILEFYGLNSEQESIEINDEERKIINLLSDGQMHIEKISSRLNKKIFEIMPILSQLEIKGIIVKSGNIFGLARNCSED